MSSVHARVRRTPVAQLDAADGFPLCTALLDPGLPAAPNAISMGKIAGPADWPFHARSDQAVSGAEDVDQRLEFIHCTLRAVSQAT